MICDGINQSVKSSQLIYFEFGFLQFKAKIKKKLMHIIFFSSDYMYQPYNT